MILIVAVIICLLILGGTGGFVFMQTRKKMRENKQYERALKMVPLFIHLPPPSDDTEVGGRDVRDVTDETISKAQVIYNIIASTLQKGFKPKMYGQRHFTLEIIGTQGFVYFYAVVPIGLVEVVKQAIVSAYPAARMEETVEHNIFNQVGRATGVIGGDLNLKESYAYPIATYQDIKRDALQSVLNSLSTLEKEDGAAIQILLRPADPSWRKTAVALANKKRKGDDKKHGISQWGKDLLWAPVKPPEEKKEGGESKKELSNLEHSTLDAIDDKTRHPGYEVQIRVIASSNVSQRSEAIVRNIVASFSLFDSPGKNGFSYSATKDLDTFIADYNLRMFRPGKKANILNSVELATIFHFPDQRNIPTTQLTRQDSKQVDGPRNVPDDGLLLGYNVFRGVKKPIRIALSDRQRHMYAVGQTGTGKSTFLENLAFQDMLNGNGFAFVDPHGDTAEKLLAMIPRERTEDLIYFSPADMGFPMGLNLFEYDDPDQKDFLIQECLNMLYKLYDPQHQGIMGPRYEHLFRMAALTVMADPAGGTFVDIPKLFRDPKFVEQKLQYVKDQNVLDFWRKEMPQSQRSNDFGEVVSWFVSKFGAFLSNEMMRNIIGQTKSAFNLRDIMDNKKILLVNLSKGRTGDLNSKLLGMIFVMKFQAAAMSRANIPEDDRVDFSLYVDEFQNFSTDSFATIMSEARKYHLNLIVANQFTTQLTPEIRDAVFGNMGTIVSFRIGQNDVEAITKYFQPVFDADDLLRVPNHNSIIRTLIGGVPTQPFSMAMIPPLGNPNPKLADALKQLSAAKYGRPRATVETEIFARMATKEAPKPAVSAAGGFGSSPALPGAPGAASSPWQTPPAAPQPTTPPPVGTGNFLDEWLTRRQSGPAALQPTPSPWATPQAPAAPTPPAAQPFAAPQTSPLASPPPAYTPPTPVAVPAPQVPPSPMIQTMPSLEQTAPPETQSLTMEDRENLPSNASEGQGPDPNAILQRTAPASQATQLPTSHDTSNISSEELEKVEVERIAAELKQDLSKDPTPPKFEPFEPKPVAEKAKETSKADTSAILEPLPVVEAPKRKISSAEPVMPEDTIIIDAEGNLKPKDETEDAD